MSQLNLRQAPRTAEGLIAVGQGGHATLRNQTSHETSHTPPSFAKDIKRDILTLLYMRTGESLSRAQIAKALDLKKTPWLITNIELLVQRGYIQRIESTWRNGCQMFFYTTI